MIQKQVLLPKPAQAALEEEIQAFIRANPKSHAINQATRETLPGGKSSPYLLYDGDRL